MTDTLALIEDNSQDKVNHPNNEDMETENPVIIKLLGDKPLIWTAEEWLKLRQNRISGCLIGVPANFPRQVSENGLPMLLMPEEVSFVLEKGLGKIYKYKKDREFPSEAIKKDYDAYVIRTKEQQTNYYKEVCREQVIERIDSIIEGKKRKLLTKKKKENSDVTPELDLDKDALVESEVERRLTAATSSCLIEIPTSSPYICGEDLESVNWTFPETPKEKIRYFVYKDLQEKGYSITSGSKFGGDFLAYPGESWKFHAFFIIKCLEANEEIKCSDLIVNARVGVFSRKNLVVASMDDDGSIFYSSLSWPGKFKMNSTASIAGGRLSGIIKNHG